MLYARDFLGLCYSLLSARSHFHLTDDRSLPFRRQSFKIESQNHLSPQDLGVLATRHSAIPIDRFSYHSLGSSPITWNKFLIHPEDRHLAERLDTPYSTLDSQQRECQPRSSKLFPKYLES